MEPRHLELEINGRFARVNSEAIRDRRVTNAALRVLNALGLYAGKGNHCWPGTRRIAADTGIPQANVVRHLRRLAELGYVMSPQHRSDVTTTSPTDVAMPSSAMSSRHQGDVIRGGKAMSSRHQNYTKNYTTELERARAREPDQRDSKNGFRKAGAVIRVHNPSHAPGGGPPCQCDACEACTCEECVAARISYREKSAQLRRDARLIQDAWLAEDAPDSP